MNLIFIMSAWMFICALIGAIYGAVNFLAGKSALYLKMIACGVGCQMFSRLFNLVYIATQGEFKGGFNVGMLGMVGSFLFFLSANYGQMDSLVDDGTKAFRATRLKALIVPVLLVVMYMVFFFRMPDTGVRLAVGVVTAFMLPCAYYHFKHIIIYDVEMGIIRQVRAYNILAVVYAFLVLLEYIAGYLSVSWLYVVSCISVGLVTVAIIPVLKGGAGKWTLIT